MSPTPEDLQQHRENLLAHMGRVMRAAEGFERARRGRVPYEAQARCPRCSAQGTTLQYRYSDSRAVRMWCDTPGCDMRFIA